MRTGQKKLRMVTGAQAKGRDERAEARCSQSRKRTLPSKSAKGIYKKRETGHDRI